MIKPIRSMTFSIKDEDTHGTINSHHLKDLMTYYHKLPERLDVRLSNDINQIIIMYNSQILYKINLFVLWGLVCIL